MWPRLVNILIGGWLMAAPDLLNYGGPAGTNDHVIGPLILTCATIALSESVRSVRWITLTLGVWLMLSPLLFDYSSRQTLHSFSIGLLIVLMARIPGDLKERFGDGWTGIWKRRAPLEPKREEKSYA